ncbi:hypothetical protein E2320_021907, partial [Naja naja]
GWQSLAGPTRNAERRSARLELPSGSRETTDPGRTRVWRLSVPANSRGERRTAHLPAKGRETRQLPFEEPDPVQRNSCAERDFEILYAGMQDPSVMAVLSGHVLKTCCISLEAEIFP